MAWAATGENYIGSDAASRLARLRRLAWLIDGAFALPGTSFRFGLNSLIGLLPIGGDAVLGALSLYIVYEAAQLGLPRHKLARMVANVGIEVFAGSVPVLGDLFDMALKANLRNLAMIEEHFRGSGWARR
ncbi:DUF4112 domain-containing protein [Rhodopila sp.]|uniref:DUF4112 domain-containing protein n=1 Tax=Rhodopila sp. TaxID=2480087 RepID=UPI003D121C64